MRRSHSYFVLSSIGGLFVGLVSAGLGEVTASKFVIRLKMDPATSAETSVFIVIFVFTTIAVALFNVSSFVLAAPRNLLLMALIAIWDVAGVILGAQLGVRISKEIDRRKALLTLPILFAAVGIPTVITPLS